MKINNLYKSICLFSVVLLISCTSLPALPPAEIVFESTFDSQCCDSYEIYSQFTTDSIALLPFYNKVKEKGKKGMPLEELGTNYKEYGLENGINGNAKGGWYKDERDTLFYCYARPLYFNRFLQLLTPKDQLLGRHLYGIALYDFEIGGKEYHLSYHY